MSLTYIPAMECWQNALRIDNKEELRIVYSDDYTFKIEVQFLDCI